MNSFRDKVAATAIKPGMRLYFIDFNNDAMVNVHEVAEVKIGAGKNEGKVLVRWVGEEKASVLVAKATYWRMITPDRDGDMVKVIQWTGECDAKDATGPVYKSEAMALYREQLRKGTHDLVYVDSGRLVSWVMA